MNRCFLATTVLVAATSTGAVAQQLRVSAKAASSSGVALEWSGLATNYGYGVSGTASLDGGLWRYVCPVDQWPVARTHCVLETADSAAYLRVKATNRGRLVSSSVMHSATASYINLLLRLAGRPETATSDVTVYKLIYDLYDSVSDVLMTTPTNYAAILPPLFDGLHDGDAVDAAMPRVPRDIFKAEWLSDFQNNPANPLRVQLEANDLYRDWTPRAPMNLYHCSGDEIVPYGNSVVAHSNFVARGATHVNIFDMGAGLSHSGGLAPCSEAAKDWFDTLR